MNQIDFNNLNLQLEINLIDFTAKLIKKLGELMNNPVHLDQQFGYEFVFFEKNFNLIAKIFYILQS